MKTSFLLTHDPLTAHFRVRESAKRHFNRAISYQGSDLSQTLQELPILTKADLSNYAQTQEAEFLARGILFSETSGTTALPLQTPRGKQDLGWNANNQMIAYKSLVQPGIDRVALLHPSVLSPFIEASALALHNLGVGYIRVFPIPYICDYQRIFDVIKRYQITTLMSTPTLIYKLLFEACKSGAQSFLSSLKKLLVTGERFLVESARNMERILGLRTIAQPFVYGASETATVMIGQSCGAYRPILEDFIFEIQAAPETSSLSLSPGENIAQGTLIITWLREGLLPILRYNTGDEFSVRKNTPHGDFYFYFEGRCDSSGLKITFQRKIESLLYSLPHPIFHFDCTIDMQEGSLIITLITQPESSLDKDEVTQHITSVLGKNWKIKVNINPKEHSFYAFSPSAKIQRFHSC